MKEVYLIKLRGKKMFSWLWLCSMSSQMHPVSVEVNTVCVCVVHPLRMCGETSVTMFRVWFFFFQFHGKVNSSALLLPYKKM